MRKLSKARLDIRTIYFIINYYKKLQIFYFERHEFERAYEYKKIARTMLESFNWFGYEQQKEFFLNRINNIVYRKGRVYEGKRYEWEGYIR